MLMIVIKSILKKTLAIRLVVEGICQSLESGLRNVTRQGEEGGGRTGRGVGGSEGETTAFLTARGNQGGGSLKADWLCKRGVCYA